ncbi:hypothetical protein EG345_06740 [Chryseobacterium carnipullorum]|uniref:hypothetical protein n=1 Tax=Chryseobacterium carnipullorum TaxID=1124835 RepID=UPI000F4F3FAA|nr:hypothetical protein [Chryseobacterium carnipullorum]AZA64432.1 hypothetical protein EG345_06740 [Chryseobacterium carnipullorum]
MNYDQFSGKDDLINQILIRQGILISEKIIIKIDHQPDYEISEYKREQDADYYFYNSWKFKNKFNSVFDISVSQNHIFHFDNFNDLSNNYNIPFNIGSECDFLLDVLKKDSDALFVYGFGIETDNFTIHNVRIKAIDNLKGRVYYDGSFTGSSYEIDPLDWGIYSILDISACPIEIDDKPFYNSLLAESYLLLKERKYKLSYFLLYSAFESFVNFELGKGDEEGRLKDKLNELFCLKFPNLGIHQIYTSVITFLTNTI